ncbi:MAG: hypothetical protein KAV00_00110 [Phycisphaerae bacterium]|nr:hypothetical protein [Phycisphaerae bacterium]
MNVVCPRCKNRMAVERELAGKTIRCPACQNEFTVEAAPQQPTVEPTPIPTPANPLPQGVDKPCMGKMVLAIGLTLVLLGRGADSIGNRGVSRAKAKLRGAKGQFEDKWARKMAQLDEGGSDYHKQSRELRDDKGKERKRLQRDEWLDLESDARNARAANDINGYWREWVFVIGSILLTLGAFAVAFRGTGAERLACLVLIGIITFSIYIGGVAWIGSIINTAKGGSGF